MKKVLRFAGIALIGLICIGLFGFLFINFRGIPSYEVEKIDFQAVSTAQSVTRGKKLSLMLCAHCHTNPETGKLTGRWMKGAPQFGKIMSANITQDKAFGIGQWSDADLLYLLRTGIKRDGQYAPPYMAKLPTMADEDLNAIISFLRSDDKLVAADPTPDPPSQPSFLTKFLCIVAFKPFPMPTAPIPLPDTTDMIAMGEYMAHNLECFSCHSADFTTNDFLHPASSKGYFGGGNEILNEAGQVVISSNLTPDPETGIGNWTESRFVRAVKYGLKDGEKGLQPPMVPFVHLTDTEVRAIYQYLQTIPPIKNKIERAVHP